MKACGKPTVSRADLVRLYGALGFEALDSVSVFTGYRRKHDTKQSIATPGVLELTSSLKASSSTADVDLSLDDQITMPFWRPESCQSINKEDRQGQAPEEYTKAVALEATEIQADPSLRPPTPQPLCPWSRMWPFQRSALGAVQDRGAVDIPKVVRTAAEMRPMRRLPRVLRRGWARRSLLIVDIDTRLLPFWQDMRRLYRNLLKIRGATGLDLLLFEQGPLGPVGQPGKEESTLSSFKPPETNTPILIISDLGLFDRTDHITKNWLQFGKKLNRTGFSPVVLTPAPRRLWIDELAAVFRMACWDRGQPLPKLTDPRSPGSRPNVTDEQRKGTQLLLSLLAPAIRVEPELLRAVRMLLPADQCDAGDEAAAWHHDHVRRGCTGFSFDPQHIADLRKAFVHDHSTELKQRVCELIEAHHRHLSPAVIKEEKLIADMLVHGQPSEDADKFFWSSLQALSQSDFKEKKGLKAWMQRVVHRQEQDPDMWQSRALCAVWAKANYENWTRGKVVQPKGLDPESVTWVWPKEGLAQSYILFRCGGHFIAENQSQTESSDDAPYSSGSPVIDLVSSNGVLQVQVLDGEDEKETYIVNLKSQTPVPIEVPDEGQLRLITTHHDIVLKFTQKPSWAQGWGRDEQGLFVILPHEKQTRKAYWFAPGRYPVGDYTARLTILPDPERIGLLDGGLLIDINDGFWWDEHDFRQTFGTRVQESGWDSSFGQEFGTGHYGFQKPEWASAFGVDQYGIYAEFYVRSTVQRMRWIMPGEFMMGSQLTEPDRRNDEQKHKVVLTSGFWLADTTCTQALWQAVMGDNPSKFIGDNNPVDSVSWDDVQTFITKINAKIPGLELHIPTEAQWEYACRAGTTTPFHFGDNITTDQVNFDGNHIYNEGNLGEYRKKTVPVKSFECNDWGLYEMHGNVWEWCADWYGEYPETTVVDPLGPGKGNFRVLRGGSWTSTGWFIRSARRLDRKPLSILPVYSFRVARGQTESRLSGGVGQSKGALKEKIKSLTQWNS